MEYNLLSRRK